MHIFKIKTDQTMIYEDAKTVFPLKLNKPDENEFRNNFLKIYKK